MTNKIGFFTPIRYPNPKTWGQCALEKVEGFFDLRGRVAQVVPGNVLGHSQGVKIQQPSQYGPAHYLFCAIKIALWCTPFISAIAITFKTKVRYPSYVVHSISILSVIMLIIKTGFRLTHSFHIIVDTPTAIPPPRSAAETASTAIQSTSAHAAAIPRPAQHLPTLQNYADTTVASLMGYFTAAWNSNTAEFNVQPDFDINRFTALLTHHVGLFRKQDISNEQHFGYIEKFDLDPAQYPQIYMRADLHGDLKSLIENIRSLQQQGFLDEQFRCQPGVHLIFLGDYCDRGHYGTQILEMLMRLREENPLQVHLIRGNHEYTETNRGYSLYNDTDPRLKSVLKNNQAGIALEQFYETMALTAYFSVTGPQRREYIQCTHGLFEPAMDPAPLLDTGPSGSHLPVPQKREFSERIQQIAASNGPCATSAQKIQALITRDCCWPKFPKNFTIYNWGDVDLEGRDFSILGDPGQRAYVLCAQDIQHYLNVSSADHRVMMLFRGHKHAFQHVSLDKKVITTTLTVGSDCEAYASRCGGQSDRAYIIRLTSQIERSTKRAILRAPKHAATDEITAPYWLTSDQI